MARIEWVKQRLNNWAEWKDREVGGGLGYATSSVLLSEPGGGYREAAIPIDDIDASVTNTAVESLRPTRRELYETLQEIYIQNIGVTEAARRTGCAVSTIKARLDRADHALSEWFGERAEKQKRVFTP
jgi:hypothetical protein